VQTLKEEKLAGKREGVGLVDLQKCFETVQKVKEDSELEDAAWFVLHPDSWLVQGWDWIILLLSFYFYSEVPVNWAFRSSTRLGTFYTIETHAATVATTLSVTKVIFCCIRLRQPFIDQVGLH
jgi:hypothetical protein